MKLPYCHQSEVANLFYCTLKWAVPSNSKHVAERIRGLCGTQGTADERGQAHAGPWDKVSLFQHSGKTNRETERQRERERERERERGRGRGREREFLHNSFSPEAPISKIDLACTGGFKGAVLRLRFDMS